MSFELLGAIGALLALAWFASALRALREWRATPELVPLPPPKASPEVRVFVPMRDERRHIGDCLAALRAQTWPALEIHVIDDGSTDGSDDIVAAIAEQDPRVKLHRAPLLPAGCFGKPHALWTCIDAQRESLPPWLLFVDADTRLHPGAVSALVQAAKSYEAGLVTVVPRFTLAGFWERLLQPAVAAILSLHHRPSRINDPALREAAFANGQVIFVERDAYLRHGGHQAVLSEVLEDVALARHLKGQGVPLLLAAAPQLVSTEMYRGLGELWEGWRKNFVQLAGGRPEVLIGTTLLALLLGASPTVLAIVALATLPLAQAGIFVVLWAAITSLQGTLRWLAGRAPPHYALLSPLSSLLLVALAIDSGRGQRQGGAGITWKGRRYAPAAEEGAAD